MENSQDRFKVTSVFDPAYGGGYRVIVEDLNTGECQTTWAYDKAGVKPAAERITQGMTANAEAPETFYLGEAESPAEDAEESPAIEASE
jgi:hypothetical protein